MSTKVIFAASVERFSKINTKMDTTPHSSIISTGFAYGSTKSSDDIFDKFSNGGIEKCFQKKTSTSAVNAIIKDYKNIQFPGGYCLGQCPLMGEEATGNILLPRKYFAESVDDLKKTYYTESMYYNWNKYAAESKILTENYGGMKEEINLRGALSKLAYANEVINRYAFKKITVTLTIAEILNKQNTSSSTYVDNTEFGVVRYYIYDDKRNNWNAYYDIGNVFNVGICNMLDLQRQYNNQGNVLSDQDMYKPVLHWRQKLAGIWKKAKYNRAIFIDPVAISGKRGGQGGGKSPSCDDKIIRALQNFIRYIKRTVRAYNICRGDELAHLLCLRDRHVFYLNPPPNYIDLIKEYCKVDELTSILIQHVNCFIALMAGDLSSAFDYQHGCTISVVDLLNKPQYAHENWTLELLYNVAVDLRIVAQKTATTGFSVVDINFLEMTGDALLRCFRTCSMENSNKRMGMRKISHQLLAVYIVLRNVDFSRPLMHNLHHLPNFPTFAYADDFLTYAFEHCPKKYIRYKYLIVIRLEILKIAKGVAPSRHRLAKYDLMVVWQIYTAVKSGNVNEFDEILHDFLSFFDGHGVFNFMNLHLRRVATINAIKKTHRNVTTNDIASINNYLLTITNSHAEAYASEHYLAYYSAGADKFFLCNTQDPHVELLAMTGLLTHA